MEDALGAPRFLLVQEKGPCLGGLGPLVGCSTTNRGVALHYACYRPRFLAQPSLPPRVVYWPPEAGQRYGIITAIPRRVFLRFDDQHYSRAVNPAYLGVYQTTAQHTNTDDGD